MKNINKSKQNEKVEINQPFMELGVSKVVG